MGVGGLLPRAASTRPPQTPPSVGPEAGSHSGSSRPKPRIWAARCPSDTLTTLTRIQPPSPLLFPYPHPPPGPQGRPPQQHRPGSPSLPRRTRGPAAGRKGTLPRRDHRPPSLPAARGSSHRGGGSPRQKHCPSLPRNQSSLQSTVFFSQKKNPPYQRAACPSNR